MIIKNMLLLSFFKPKGDHRKHSIKQIAGAVLFDLPRFAICMRSSNRASWMFMCNRNERLIQDELGIGVRCDWRWTSDLHAAKVFPLIGRFLMQRALSDWPISLFDTPISSGTEPDITFIIGHKGLARLPHLLLTIESIAGQKGPKIECIVVEQSPKQEIKTYLPHWVRYVYTPLIEANAPYNRSWAFNVGARLARSRVLVLHDNDMLIPADYAKEIITRAWEGYEAINLKRFIFYLSKNHTSKVFSKNSIQSDVPPQTVVQNLEAGGSLAVLASTYFEIGGFDESFVGWGGEDNEFWDRAQTRKVWPYGYLPIVHLYHEPQTGKLTSKINTSQELFWELYKECPYSRIKKLIKKPFGSPSQPNS